MKKYISTILTSRWGRIGGFVLGLLFVWFMIRKCQYCYYDHLPPTVVLTPEDLTMIVDFNHDAQISPCETNLLEGVRKRIVEAKRSDRNFYVDVGHIHLDDWFEFEHAGALLDYCRRSGSRSLIVKSRFNDIPEPFYCIGGCGAYLEMDAELNIRALWVYRQRIANALHLAWPFRRYNKDYTSTTATEYIDKHFGWKRFPLALVADKLGGEPQEQEGTGTQLMEIDELLSRVEKSWERHPIVKQKLMPLVLKARETRSDHALYDLARAAAGEEHKDFRYTKRATMEVYHRIAREPDETVTAAIREECLFLAAYHFARDGSSVAAIDTFSMLESEYPESKYLTSATLYKADAYAHMGRTAWFVSRDAATTYFDLARGFFDLLIRRAEEGNDDNLLGVSLECAGGGTMLVDDMLGQSAGEWAKKLSLELARNRDRLEECVPQ